MLKTLYGICLLTLLPSLHTGTRSLLALEAPRIAKVTPANGSRDVPTDVGRIVIVFDRNMKTDSHSLFIHPSNPFPPNKWACIAPCYWGKRLVTLPATSSSALPKLSSRAYLSSTIGSRLHRPAATPRQSRPIHDLIVR